MPKASAETAYNLKTFGYVAVRPNPVQVSQEVLVAFWLTPPVDYAGISTTGINFKMTAPNGTVFTRGPFTTEQSDRTGWFIHSFDAVGNWTIQLIYDGDYFPAGTPYRSSSPPFPFVGTIPYNLSYSPCESPITKIEVTTTPAIGSYKPTPLPTEYWSLPISVENREWSQLLGDWHMVGYSSKANNFQPYGGAPTTSHILWSLQTGPGGAVGGSYGDALYSGNDRSGVRVVNGTETKSVRYWTVNNQITETIAGLGFYTPQDGTTCVNLETGEKLWFNPDIKSSTGNGGLDTKVYTQSEEFLDTSGGVPCDAWNAYLMQIANGRLCKWIAYTGTLICNVSAMDGTYDCPYFYTIQTIGSARYLIKWTAEDITSNFADRIIYNVSYPFRGITGIYDSPNIAGAIGGAGILPGNDSVGFYFGNTEVTATAKTYPSGAFKTSTGEVLWTKTYPSNIVVYNRCSFIADPGVYTFANYNADPNNEGLKPLVGINVFNGEILYDDATTSYPWGCFWPYSEAAGYGMSYIPCYDGNVYAFNSTTGATVWKGGFNNVGYQTPYGVQPFFAAIVVGGGIVFAGNDEHSETAPYYQGKQMWALNATTGATIWTIPFFSPGFASAQMLLSNGKLIATNYYDGRIYCFDKGPSATTVTAPNLGVTTATPITITGTVLDISAGQPQNSVKFPNGLPCVSDESMSGFMAYAYMQKSRPSNATGVPVTLSVIDSNGNFRQIGTTTSNAYGTFSYVWTPDISGEYTVIAEFAGSESYYPSSASTAFYASETATTSSPQPLAAQSPTEMYFAASTAAIIIAIAIGFAITIISIRKKP